MRIYKNILLIILSMLIMTGISIAYTKDFMLLDVKYSELTPDAQKQVKCLADNIYYEAGRESVDGKKAVALVTLNRVEHESFPKDICSVVKQKTNHQGVTICQFSWFCSSNRIGKFGPEYDESMDVALHVYANYELLDDITKGAIYYHADYINPKWQGVKKTTKIGRHIFYKEGEKNNDAKTKPTTKRGQLEALVLPTNGRRHA